MFVLKLDILGTKRAANTISKRRKGASQRVAIVSATHDSTQNTRIGPSKKPTPNTMRK
jgi:hypothetical protein